MSPNEIQPSRRMKNLPLISLFESLTYSNKFFDYVVYRNRVFLILIQTWHSWSGHHFGFALNTKVVQQCLYLGVNACKLYDRQVTFPSRQASSPLIFDSLRRQLQCNVVDLKFVVSLSISIFPYRKISARAMCHSTWKEVPLKTRIFPCWTERP